MSYQKKTQVCYLSNTHYVELILSRFFEEATRLIEEAGSIQYKLQPTPAMQVAYDATADLIFDAKTLVEFKVASACFELKPSKRILH